MKQQKRRRRRKQSFDIRYAIYGAAAVLLLVVIIFLARGCGVSNKTPKKVVESLVENSVAGKEKKVRRCYSSEKEISSIAQKEIEATIAYYEAHRPKKVEIKQCDTLSEKGDATYVYIIYDLLLENDQRYPCIGTHMVKKEDKKYYIISSDEITESMRTEAAEAYAKFMTTDMYKEYTKNYEAFIKRNPGYEEKIAGRVG